MLRIATPFVVSVSNARLSSSQAANGIPLVRDHPNPA